jgi:hypothetical protein
LRNAFVEAESTLRLFLKKGPVDQTFAGLGDAKNVVTILGVQLGFIPEWESQLHLTGVLWV